MNRIISILAALVLYAIGGQFEVPIGPVPFILTDFFVFFAAIRLGGLDFLVSVLLYLGLGALGAPVFAGGSGGFQHLIGPTVGYLFGYLIGGLMVNYFHKKLDRGALQLVNVFFGYYLLFILGITGLFILTEMKLQEAIEIGFMPFILSMHLKATAAWGVNKLFEKHN
ncbi:MAG: biotin transporter BioY [Bacteroidia bacterium]